jgi:hypothetical protein
MGKRKEKESKNQLIQVISYKNLKIILEKLVLLVMGKKIKNGKTNKH